MRATIRGRLRGAGPERDVCILDVSSRGLLAMTADPPGRGDYVEILAAGHSLVGHVQWASARRFGLVLHEQISVAALIHGEGGPITLKARKLPRPGARPVAALLADSRSFANLFQFVTIIAAIVASAGLLAISVGHWLGEPLGRVGAVLEGSQRR